MGHKAFKTPSKAAVEVFTGLSFQNDKANTTVMAKAIPHAFQLDILSLLNAMMSQIIGSMASKNFKNNTKNLLKYGKIRKIIFKKFRIYNIIILFSGFCQGFFLKTINFTSMKALRVF